MKKAIITGASSGLGYEIAKTLLIKKYKVINISRSAAEIKNIENINADLSNNKDIERVCAKLKKEHSDTEVLVLNSGLLLRNIIGECKDEDIDYEFSVNITSMIKIVNAMTRILKQNKGDIVIIGSTSAFAPATMGSSVYVSSKHAVLGYIKALQFEFKQQDVRVIGVHPGGFQSEFHVKAKSDLKQDDLMDPKYIANLIINVLELPRNMEVGEIIINRKKK